MLRKNFFDDKIKQANNNCPDDNLNDIIDSTSTILKELKDQYKVDLNQDLLLNDRYKIIEKLGFGAQANVYTACDLKDANKM